LNKIVNLLYGTRYTDLCYGYNAFRRECLEVMELDVGEFVDVEQAAMPWGNGFEMETLINVRIAKSGLRVCEVPSYERCRGFGVSNLNALSDGMRVLSTIHAEHKHGTRRISVTSRSEGRAVSDSWLVLSTLAEEAS
jgi:hypothetical protein